jgi:integrase/recombinase XerC
VGDLILHTGGDLVKRAQQWAELDPGERRRRAVAACRDRDTATLWDLTLARLTLYSKSAAKLSPNTLRAYREGVSCLLDAWQGVDLLNARKDQGALYLRSLEQRGLSSSTVSVRLAAARALYAALRWATETPGNPRGDCGDPFEKLAPARDLTPSWERRKPYSDEDVRRLLSVSSGPDRLMILLGSHAGLRAFEMTALRFEHIDLSQRQLTVMAGKGGKRATVALSRTLTEELRSQWQDTGYVLRLRTPEGLRYRMRSLCRLAEVKYRSLHSLRHQCGTKLQKDVSDIYKVARHLRHASVSTTEGYIAWAEESLRHSVGEW